MNIVDPYARIIQPCDGVALMSKIEWCGRISHRSEETQAEDSWRRFIPAVVMGHGDWSIVEHASVSVDMLVDRGITHEIVRHRLFSFTQESTRFVNYEKKMPPSFIMPDFSGIAYRTEAEAAWREGSTKDRSISRLYGGTWSWKRIQLEISKCEVLCSNCHLKLHRKLDNAKRIA